MSAGPRRPRAASQRAALRRRARVLIWVTAAALVFAGVCVWWGLVNRANAEQAAQRATTALTAPSTPPVCVDALERATALLDAQEEALAAIDDGTPGNLGLQRAEAAAFDRAGLHAAAEQCRASANPG